MCGAGRVPRCRAVSYRAGPVPCAVGGYVPDSMSYGYAHDSDGLYVKHVHVFNVIHS